MNQEEEISRDLMKLALVLLVTDLNWTGFMKLPVERQMALAASGGLSPDELIVATEQLGDIVKARRDVGLRATPPSVHGAN